MGKYQVLARTWRPQNFEQLVGQRHIAQTLTNAIESGRLAHAYLFSGLRGTGKTTVARILAKCLNCERGPLTKPCDACDSCREIAESRALDVFEIDAASRTKVEQTRELLDMLTYAPVRDRNKILIIDEVHMLSKNSFNALLKTLEEPPPNVIFVLATTELQKILPTILSRCQVFEFRRVTAREVAEHLTRICEAEGIKISPASLDRIARAGEGSVRDSLSILERVVAFCGHEVGDEEVLRLMGAVSANILAETLRSLAARDAGGMLRVLDRLVDEGHDLLHFWNELIAALRDLLFLEALPDRVDLLSRPPEEAPILLEAASGLTREDLTRAFQILADVEFALKNSSRPRFMFEATLIRLASLGSVRPIEELLQSFESGAVDTTTRVPAQKKSPAEGLSRPPAPASEARPSPVSPARPAVVAVAADAPAPGGGGLRSDLLARLQSARPMLAAVLQQAQAVELDGAELLVQFRDEDSAMAQPLLRDDGIALLKKHADAVAGRDIKVRVVVGRDAPPADPVSVAAAAPAPADRSQKKISKAGLIERAKRDPGVKKLLREFGAQVVEIRPMAAPSVENESQEEI